MGMNTGKLVKLVEETLLEEEEQINEEFISWMDALDTYMKFNVIDLAVTMFFTFMVVGVWKGAKFFSALKETYANWKQIKKNAKVAEEISGFVQSRQDFKTIKDTAKKIGNINKEISKSRTGKKKGAEMKAEADALQKVNLDRKKTFKKDAQETLSSEALDGLYRLVPGLSSVKV